MYFQEQLLEIIMRSEACLVLLRKTGTQLFNLSPSGTGNIQVKAVTAIVFYTI